MQEEDLLGLVGPEPKSEQQEQFDLNNELRLSYLTAARGDGPPLPTK